MENIKPKFVFFGTPEFAVVVLDKLKDSGFLPSLVVTSPDRPAGRKLIITPPPVKVWAKVNNIPVVQPEKLDNNFIEILKNENFDLGIVAAYGKIIPQNVIDSPKYGILNIHPSLLPKYRGPSPVESQIWQNEKNTGVTIIKLDALMDHGPIVLQRSFPMPTPLPNREELHKLLWNMGGEMISEVIPKWINGEINPIEQDHTEATFTKKLIKDYGLLKFEDSGEMSFRRFQAMYGSLGTYFFTEKNGKKIRVIIKDASFEDGKFVIKKVLPEGKKEISYKDFLNK